MQHMAMRMVSTYTIANQRSRIDDIMSRLYVLQTTMVTCAHSVEEVVGPERPAERHEDLDSVEHVHALCRQLCGQQHNSVGPCFATRRMHIANSRQPP